ncbi:unnamed protein product [Mytilus coruscus]|uniref:Uncharacterized protein n=1 Tax=Mytilus coruscus TaxID=42192 RepID=A0A6J8F423_MYTCO|nr:unnamed protein product [Mytilus coruscus]
MLNRDLDRSDFVKIVHIGIQIANEDGSDEMEPPRKKKKKRSEKPNVPSSTCYDSLLENKDTINDRISELESLLQRDLGSVLTDQIKWLPNNEGILLRLVTGKTKDIREQRIVFVFPSSNVEICSYYGMENYVKFCKKHDIALTGGYFFRPLASSQNKILDSPFSLSTTNARLKLYLKDLDLWKGETLHSTRSCCTLTLAWLGISNKIIKSHVGCKSDDMLKHYIAPNVLCDKIKSAKSLSKTSEIIPANVFANIENSKS